MAKDKWSVEDISMYYNTFVSGDFVYAYVNPIFGIIYIGITNDLVRRICEHDTYVYDNVNKNMI